MVSAITGLSVYAIEQVETQRSQAQYRQVATVVTAAVERLVNSNVVYLKAGAAMLSMQPSVTRAAFQEFARQVDRDPALRGGGALGWGEFVAASDVPALERAMRQAGDPGFRVWPTPVGGQTLPRFYVSPNVTEVRHAIGFDSLSELSRRQAVERAISTGRPTATGPVRLQSDPTMQDASGFVIYAPVFRQGERRERAIGMLARGFDSRNFLKAALGPERLSGYGITILDGETPERTVIASTGPQARSSRRIVRPIVLADHRMIVEVSPPAATTLSKLSLLTLLFGMMVAALLLIVARLVTQQAAEDRAALAWFEEQASIRNSLTRELNHRVKNTLANVLSIVSLTRRRTNNIDEFVDGLIGRIRALSATHDLLTQSEWGTTPVASVVRAELAPYAQSEAPSEAPSDVGADAQADRPPSIQSASEQAVSMRGPNVELAPNDALSLGLALHELATNASKYGALSVPGGRVDVTWEMITDKLARVDWAEHGGPPVSQARRRGFGTDLIEKIVAHELRNPVDLRFEEGGVRCTLVVPVRLPAAFQLRGSQGAASQPDGSKG